MSINLGEQISILRKERRLTQEDLAKLLGVTNQAVSKWESDKCCPDIELLPELARVFDCSIDKLFGISREPTACTTLPWADDDIIRGVVCEGRKILSVKDGVMGKFTFEIKGDAKAVKTHCNLTVTGNTHGSCAAANSITVGGSINGAVNCGDSISCGGNIGGGINCGDGVRCGGNIKGDVTCGSKIECTGDIGGNVLQCKELTCEGNIQGDVTCEKAEIKGNVEGKLIIKDKV